MGLRDLIPAIEWSGAPGVFVVGDDFNGHTPGASGWGGNAFGSPYPSYDASGPGATFIFPNDPGGDGTDAYYMAIDVIAGGIYGDVWSQNARVRTFGAADGLLPDTAYRVSVQLKLHTSLGNIGNVVTTGDKNCLIWGLYVEGAGTSSMLLREQEKRVPDPPYSTVKILSPYVNPYPYWQTLRVLATTDGAGDLTVKFGIFSAHNWIAQINYDNVVIEEASSAHRLLFPYPPEDVRSYRRPLPGSQRLTLPSGETDAWMLGHGGIWTCEARWIPAVSQLALPDNDGWEDRDDSGVIRAGWDRFLRHAAAGGEFTFYPDSTDSGTSYQCVWDEASAPLAPALEDDMTRLQQIAFRTTDGALVTGYSQ